ncbi:MAG: hypothetical protein A2Z20_02155 [Bdellovibrionales bacterium RBG_16_40_8]|nr:MAG: hypothetical protein A2Z20_02155 [Bdellovibrionales bacterium RBG_16_40_8]
MRKLAYLLLPLALVIIGACSKKGGNNNNNPYGYNGNGYNQYGCPNNGLGGYQNYGNAGAYGGHFQWRNGTCIDVRNNSKVNPTNCQNSNLGYANGNNNNNNYYGANCNYFAGNNLINNGGNFGGGFGGGYNSGICSQFNTATTVSYPVYFPGTGQTLCVEYSTVQFINSYAHIYNYGTPYMSSAYANAYIGCNPSIYTPNCRCKTMDGQLGWISGGFYAGICF